ncbi:MAG: hypothetical protein EOO41_04665, partial [Methanobacteriota archaeon]
MDGTKFFEAVHAWVSIDAIIGACFVGMLSHEDDGAAPSGATQLTCSSVVDVKTVPLCSLAMPPPADVDIGARVGKPSASSTPIAICTPLCTARRGALVQLTFPDGFHLGAEGIGAGMLICSQTGTFFAQPMSQPYCAGAAIVRLTPLGDAAAVAGGGSSEAVTTPPVGTAVHLVGPLSFSLAMFMVDTVLPAISSDGSDNTAGDGPAARLNRLAAGLQLWLQRLCTGTRSEDAATRQWTTASTDAVPPAVARIHSTLPRDTQLLL